MPHSTDFGKTPDMLAAALWYAKHGIKIIPVHVPLFGPDGVCTGCTCEAHRRTKVPGFVCETPGKHPVHKDWENVATTATNQLRAWWGGAWLDGGHVPNIGMPCGPNNLLGLDLDVYKPGYTPPQLGPGGEDTVRVWRPGEDGQAAGRHRWYQMEPGDTYGNSAGTVGAGCDTRGHGGQLLVPPSLHYSGNRYQFEDGHALGAVGILPIPPALRALLDAGQAVAGGVAVGAGQAVAVGRGGAVGLADADLIDHAMRAKNGDKFRRLWDGVAAGYDSPSEADQALCNHLAWWAAGDVERIDRLFRASGLYREKWEREDYRARTIGKAVAQAGAGYSPPPRGQATNGSGPGRAVDASTGEITESPQGAQDSPGGAGGAGYLLALDADHEGHAQAVFRRTGGRFLHTRAFGWLEWNNTHWGMGGADYRLDRAIVDTLQARRHAAIDAKAEGLIRAAKPTTGNVTGTRNLLQSINWAEAKDFDGDGHLLNTLSGVVDLRTGAILAHGPGQRFTYCTATPYTPQADRGPWLQFLAETVGNYAQLADWLQMAVGYSVTGGTVEDAFFYLYGPTRAGKGLFTTALHNMLGQALARGTSFNTFTRARGGDDQGFDLAPLHRCRIVTASESGRYDKMNEAAVKTMTGGDPLTAAYKGKDQFSFVPRWKVWVSSNHPLRGDPDDAAFWGRARVIEFPHSHLGSEDKGLRERLESPDLLAGALAWAVEGAGRWYAALPHGLKTPGTVATLTAAQREDQDTVGKWLGECCNLGDGEGWTANALLYASYKNWCVDNGVTPKQLTQWGQTLTQKGVTEARRQSGGRVQRGRLGVSIAE